MEPRSARDTCRQAIRQGVPCPVLAPAPLPGVGVLGSGVSGKDRLFLGLGTQGTSWWRVCAVIVLCFPLATLVKGPERKARPAGDAPVRVPPGDRSMRAGESAAGLVPRNGDTGLRQRIRKCQGPGSRWARDGSIAGGTWGQGGPGF